MNLIIKNIIGVEKKCIRYFHCFTMIFLNQVMVTVNLCEEVLKGS